MSLKKLIYPVGASLLCILATTALSLNLTSCSDSDKDDDEPSGSQLFESDLIGQAWESETDEDYFITDDYADRDMYITTFYFFPNGKALEKQYHYTYDYVAGKHDSETNVYAAYYLISGNSVNISSTNGYLSLTYRKGKLTGGGTEYTPRSYSTEDNQLIERYRYLIDGTDPDDSESFDLTFKIVNTTVALVENDTYLYNIEIHIGGTDLVKKNIQYLGYRPYVKRNGRWQIEEYDFIFPEENGKKTWRSYFVFDSWLSTADIKLVPVWYNSVTGKETEGEPLYHTATYSGGSGSGAGSGSGSGSGETGPYASSPIKGKWKGAVDGVTVTLVFNADGTAKETALGSTDTGTFSYSGNTLTWNVEGIVSNTFGSSITVKSISSTRLVLEDQWGWDSATFTKQ